MAWPGSVCSGDLTIDGDMKVASLHSFICGDGANVASGQNVLAFANSPTPPSSLAGLVGGILWVGSGTLMYMGATGTVTSLASL